MLLHVEKKKLFCKPAGKQKREVCT